MTLVGHPENSHLVDISNMLNLNKFLQGQKLSNEQMQRWSCLISLLVCLPLVITMMVKSMTNLSIFIFLFSIFVVANPWAWVGFCDIKITPPSINLRLKFSWNNFVCYELLLGTQTIFPLHYGVNLASTSIYLIVI